MPNPELQAKWDHLLEILCRVRPLAVAFSGGVDSGLLAAAAYQALGADMKAFMFHSTVEDAEALAAAQKTSAEAGFPLDVVPFDDLEAEVFRANPTDRCYHCKRRRFSALLELAAERGFTAVAEGSNADDRAHYRPGSRAVAELQVLSPLQEANLRKAEIRALAKELGLSIWERPSAPCLATRFPYGSEITQDGLRRVDSAEKWLKSRGYRQIRVRDYGKMARIEVDEAQIGLLINERKLVADTFKQIGYEQTAVDLLGYRSGSLDEGINTA